MQHGSGVDMGDSNVDTIEQDEDKMEESNIDHNKMCIPVCIVGNEPCGYEVCEFWIISEDLQDIMSCITDLRKEYRKALPQLKEMNGRKFKEFLKSHVWLEAPV